ncbi:MAG: hypothetical protein ACI4JN_08235 [Ruminococcus sp.]
MKKKKTTKKSSNFFDRMHTDSFCVRSLVHNVKTLFLPWLILSVLALTLITAINVAFSAEVNSVTADISLYYDGIEEGLGPNGCEFDKQSIKDEKIVSQALDEMNLSQDLLESVCSGIIIKSKVSTDAISGITNYKSIYSSDMKKWTESMKDTSYHPTAFEVSFNYSETSLNGSEASDLLNLILEKYHSYFFELYGYNGAVGDAVLEVDFDDYDYLMALDIFGSRLKAVESYLDTLSKNEKAQFRSDVTGYTFADLKNSVNLIRSVDIDALSSYILKNGVISDKDMILSYYDFRINNLKRQKQYSNECLNSAIASINSYQKDAVVFYDGLVDSSTTVTNTSELYDNLIQEKIKLQNEISSYDSQISDYNERLNAIKKSTGKVSDSNKKYVESQLDSLLTKTQTIIKNISDTANDYYESEKFENAVSITKPASYSVLVYIKTVVKESMRIIIISELFIVLLYLSVSITACFGDSFRRYKSKHITVK